MNGYEREAARLAAAFPVEDTPANRAELDLMVSGRAVVDVGAVLAENERLRAFAAEQNDQLLEANAEIERLRLSVSTLAAQTVDAQGKAKYWKAEYNEGQRRLEIIQRALVEAGLIEGEWDGSEEEETR